MTNLLLGTVGGIVLVVGGAALAYTSLRELDGDPFLLAFGMAFSGLGAYILARLAGVV